MTTTETIHTAMVAIMDEVGYVQKEGKMQGAISYRFAGEADFIHAIRPAMVRHGVYFYPSAITNHTSETYQTSKGSVMNLDKVAMEFTFVHAASGTSFKAVAMGAGADSGDKAIPKMLTGALKYALRQSFLIETGDDPDNTSSDDQERGNDRRQFPHNRPPTAQNAPTPGSGLRSRVDEPSFETRWNSANTVHGGDSKATIRQVGAFLGMAAGSTWLDFLGVAESYCEGANKSPAQLIQDAMEATQ